MRGGWLEDRGTIKRNATIFEKCKAEVLVKYLHDLVLITDFPCSVL